MELKLGETEPLDQVHSPVKVTWLASTWSGFLVGKSDGQRRGTMEMSQQWIDENKTYNNPLHLADLAKRAHVNLSTLDTPRRRKKRDKGNPSTPTTADGARESISLDFGLS